MKKALAMKIVLIFIFVFSLSYFRGISNTTVPVIVSIVVVFSALTILKLKNPNVQKKDERISKLSAYAASWSWMITFFTLAILSWIDYLGIIALNVTMVISLLFVEMIITLLIFQTYFRRKGDIK